MVKCLLDKLKINQRSHYNLPNSGFWGRLPIESQPQNLEFRNNPENFHLCIYSVTVWMYVIKIHAHLKCDFKQTSKTCVKRPLKIDISKVLMENGSLMEVESIAECSPWWPALSDIRYWKPIFGVLFEWPLKTGFTVWNSKLVLSQTVKAQMKCSILDSISSGSAMFAKMKTFSDIEIHHFNINFDQQPLKIPYLLYQSIRMKRF